MKYSVITSEERARVLPVKEADKNQSLDLKAADYKHLCASLRAVKVSFLTLGYLTVGSTNIQFILKYWLDILLVYL